MKKERKSLAWILVFAMVLSLVQVLAFSPVETAYAGQVETVSGGYGYQFSSGEQQQAKDAALVLIENGVTAAADDPHYFYYQQLNEGEKALYLLMEGCTKEAPFFFIKNYRGLSEETSIFEMAGNAVSALQYDQPLTRLTFAMWRVDVREGDDIAKITLFPDPLATEYRLDKVNAIIDNIVNAVPAGEDRYTTLLDLSLYMAGTRAYNFYSEGSGAVDMSTDIIDAIDQSPYGVFLYEYAVCNAYSYACKILCDRLDIPCISVMNDFHAWNYVQMEDGNWYSLDWTYADKYFSDMTFFEQAAMPFLIEYSLTGSRSTEFLEDYRYPYPYVLGGGEKRVEVPVLSETSYVYNGTYAYSFGDVASFTEPEGRFTYEVNADGTSITITGYEGLQEGDLIIPETIDGLTVTGIGSSAFYRATGFTGKLVIPDTVKTIGDAAFLACSNLTGLTLPSSPVTIGRVAFTDCDKLPATDYNEKNGLAKGSDGNWYFYKNHQIDRTMTGLVTNDAGAWYVNEGVLDFNKSGIIVSDGKEYVVKYGYMSTGFYGLVRKDDGTWAYAEAGELTYEYTGLAKNDVGWWYITDGVIDFSYTGIGSNATGDYRVVNGQIDFSYNGWFNAEGLWYYMRGGMVDRNRTGLVKMNDKYWYLTDGEINFTFKGLVENAGNRYYVKGGYIQFDFDGEVEFEGETYMVENGMVQEGKEG